MMRARWVWSVTCLSHDMCNAFCSVCTCTGYTHTLHTHTHIHTQHSEAVRRRQLASLDLFLESARSQLQSLMSPDTSSTSDE